MRRDAPILVKIFSKGAGQLGKTRKMRLKVWLSRQQGQGGVLSGKIHLPSMPTTEIGEGKRSLEYLGRTEYVIPVSKMKKMGLPASVKITQGSSEVMVGALAVWETRAVWEPGPVSYLPLGPEAQRLRIQEAN